MAMFRLISELGNEVIETENERKRDRLIDLGYTVVAATVKTVDEMNVVELEKYAEINGIDISACKNKADKLAAIKAATE
jgi:hypothetical protein